MKVSKVVRSSELDVNGNWITIENSLELDMGDYGLTREKAVVSGVTLRDVWDFLSFEIEVMLLRSIKEASMKEYVKVRTQELLSKKEKMDEFKRKCGI